MLEFDADAARRVEAVYLTDDVVRQRREVVRLLALTAGEAVLDIGSGPGLLVLDTDWDSIVWHSTDTDRMRRILLTWEQHLADPFLPRTLGRHLRLAGFDVAPPRVLPLLNDGYDIDTYSGRLIPIVAGFVVGRHGWTAATVDGWTGDLHALGADYFFSLNRYVFLATG